MNVPRNVFHVVGCAAKDSTSYAIEGVRLQRNNAVATDGRKMVIAKWPANGSDDVECIVPPDMAKDAAAAKAGKKEGLPLEVTHSVTDDRITISCEVKGRIDRFEGGALEGRFPNHLDIASSDQPEIDLLLDLKLLKHVVDVLAKVNQSKEPRVLLRVYDEERQVEFLSRDAGGVEALGVLMPLTNSTKAPTSREWLDE